VGNERGFREREGNDSVTKVAVNLFFGLSITLSLVRFQLFDELYGCFRGFLTGHISPLEKAVEQWQGFLSLYLLQA
jgi:hypothetical protein